jgi:hypothetical protein
LGRESLEIRVPREVRTSGGEYFGKWGVLREMGSTSGNGEYFGKWGVLREMGSTSGNGEYFGKWGLLREIGSTSGIDIYRPSGSEDNGDRVHHRP